MSLVTAVDSVSSSVSEANTHNTGINRHTIGPDIILLSEYHKYIDNNATMVSSDVICKHNIIAKIIDKDPLEAN